MRKITPLGSKVLGRMIDTYGERKTHGGVIVQEAEGTSESVRPRWFEVTAVGPDQQDIKQGQYVLVPHGRWSRGLDVEGTNRKEDFIFNIDAESALGTQDSNPLD
jgi:co-chaperonin GroES (HSP10)